MDIAAAAASAEKFRARLDRAKSRIGSVDFSWYPYDSLSTFSHLAQILTGPRREILQMVGNRPILDAGCADGACSFFLESLGFRVDAVDNPGTSHNRLRGFRALKQEIGSQVELHAQDLDRQFRLPGTRYGLTLFCGLLYHLKNPFYALETLAASTEYCVLSTRVADVSPDRKTALGHLPLAYLLDDAEANHDRTNYWIFTVPGLLRLVKRAGWEVLDYGTIGASQPADPVSVDADARAFCFLRSTASVFHSKLECLSGCHHVEDGVWRWTERRFSLLLHHDPAPATLQFRFTIPQSLIDTFGPVKLHAIIGGQHLPERTFANAGDHIYSESVSAISANPTRVDFEFDRAHPGLGDDERELCVQIQDSLTSPAAIFF